MLLQDGKTSLNLCTVNLVTSGVKLCHQYPAPNGVWLIIGARGQLLPRLTEEFFVLLMATSERTEKAQVTHQPTNGGIVLLVKCPVPGSTHIIKVSFNLVQRL